MLTSLKLLGVLLSFAEWTMRRIQFQIFPLNFWILSIQSQLWFGSFFVDLLFTTWILKFSEMIKNQHKTTSKAVTKQWKRWQLTSLKEVKILKVTHAIEMEIYAFNHDKRISMILSSWSYYINSHDEVHWISNDFFEFIISYDDISVMWDAFKIESSNEDFIHLSIKQSPNWWLSGVDDQWSFCSIYFTLNSDG
jgi:hypothetical protein